jgi:hypothetical protein
MKLETIEMKFLKFFESAHPPTLPDLKQQRETLAADLEKARPVAATARDKCSDVAAGLAPGSLDAAEASARAAEDRVGSLKAALQKLDAQIAAAERSEAAEAFRHRSTEAEARAAAIADVLDAIYTDLCPKIEKARELVRCCDVVAGTFASKGLDGLGCVAAFKTAASMVRDANFGDPAVVERVERLAAEAKVLQS